MSYPRKLQVLIIEDKNQWVERYEEILKNIVFEEYPETSEAEVWNTPLLGKPHTVNSYSAAVAELKGPKPYHLLIVDLGLPWEARQEADAATIEPGQKLVEIARHREEYPIPIILVISGRLALATLSTLTESLSNDFYFGTSVNKGSNEDECIKRAIRKAHEFNDVGIHIVNSPKKLFPTLSPHEEAMLRTYVAHEKIAIGVNLNWWSFGVDHFGDGEAKGTVRTKVLMGHFILDGDAGISRPTFFKFEPSENAPFVHRDAQVLNHKLAHIKVLLAKTSGSRCLLITQSASESDENPVTLLQFLRINSNLVLPAVDQIASDISTQLSRLDTNTDKSREIKSVMWTCHNQAKIENAWKLHCQNSNIPGDANPIATVEKLLNSTRTIWIKEQGCTHGDLHGENVAVDAGSRPIHAYIFDAGGMRPHVNIRDLAMLEVSLLLHQTTPVDISLVESCGDLYVHPIDTSLADVDPVSHDIVRNTHALILALRKKALEIADHAVYALMVYDYSLIQMSGLVIQASGNKVLNPADSCKLVYLTTTWLEITTDLLSE